MVDSALSDLMQKSLVRRESDGGEVRFRMLYAIRTHASAKLTKEESVKLMNKIALFLVQELFATTKLLRDGRKFWLPLKQLYNDPTLNPSVMVKLYRALQSLETTVLDSSFRNKFDRSILTSKVEPLDADYISLDIAQSNGDWDTFDREFDKFIKVHKDLTNAMIVDVLWMINRFRTESLDQIDALKKRLVGTDDHCLSFWIQEATYRARNGMHDQAEALFERAQEYAEGYSKEMETMVLIGRGFIALRENRLEEANYFLGKVDPDSAPPTSTGHHIGVLRRLGKNREAMKIAKPFFEDVYELGNFYTATTVGWDLYLLTGSSTWLRRAHDICVDDGVSTCCLFYIGLSELKSDPKQALRTFKKAQRIAINGAQRGTAFAFQSLAGTPKWKELEQEWMGTALENEIPTAQKVAALNDGDSEQVDFFLERRSKRSRTENHEQNITYTIHLGFDLGDACAAMLRLHVCIRRSTICENLAYETSSKPPKTGIESTQMFRSNWFESSIRWVELRESRTKRTDLISDAIPFLLLEESIFI